VKFSSIYLVKILVSFIYLSTFFFFTRIYLSNFFFLPFYLSTTIVLFTFILVEDKVFFSPPSEGSMVIQCIHISTVYSTIRELAFLMTQIFGRSPLIFLAKVGYELIFLEYIQYPLVLNNLVTLYIINYNKLLLAFSSYSYVNPK